MLPFLHVRSLGVHVTRSHVRALELRRLGRRVRVVGRWEVPVTEGDWAGALRRLAAEAGGGARRVYAHVDPALVRHALLPAPGDGADVAAWEETEAARRLPPGADPSAFSVRHRTLGGRAHEEGAGDDVGGHVLLVLARRDAVEARGALLAEAGLRPSFVGSAPVELACAFAFDAGFAEGAARVLLLGERPVLLRYDRGEVAAFADLDAASPAEAIAEAQLVAAQWETPRDGGTLLVTGVGADALGASELGPDPPGAHAVGVCVAGPRPSESVPPLPPAYAVAAALAVRGLYDRPAAPSLGLDLLDAAEAAARWDALGRSEAGRVGLLLGTVALLVLLALTVAGGLLDRRVADAEAAVAPLAGRLVELERERAGVERLRADLAEARALAAERTEAGRRLAQVGAALPDSAWLTGLVLQLGATDAPVLIARGDALGGAPVARLLDALERTPPFADVALVYAEHVSADEVYRQTGSHRVPLRRFEIQASLPPPLSR